MKLWDRHKHLFVSSALSLIVCVALYSKFGLVIKFTEGSQTSPYEIAKLIASICGTILGFLLTAVAMLTAVMDRKLVENMVKTGHYRVFIVDCFINIFFFLVSIVLGIAILFLINPYLSYVFYIMLFFTISAILLLVEQGRRFLIIFTKI